MCDAYHHHRVIQFPPYQVQDAGLRAVFSLYGEKYWVVEDILAWLACAKQNKTLRNSVYRKGTCLGEQEGVDFTLLILILSSIRHDG